MKYKGRVLSGPATKIVPILRSEEQGGNIYFKVKGVPDLTPFNQLCPQPIPPQVLLKGSIKQNNIEDPSYKIAILQWLKKRNAWLMVTSLRDENNENPEFETIKYDDPDTWENWEKEMADAGFVDAEMARLLNTMAEVNGLSDSLVEEARRSFLADQGRGQKELSSLMEEQKNIPSGALAKEQS